MKVFQHEIHLPQGRHGRQDRQDQGLAWILQNRTRRQQWRRADDVAATVVVLPAKNLPWRPCTYLNYMRLYDFSLQGVKCSSGF